MRDSHKTRVAHNTLAHEESRLESRLRQKVARRILPYLFLLYVIAFLDRVNVSYAALGMVRDLGLSATQMGFGLGIFFIGYFILKYRAP